MYDELFIMRKILICALLLIVALSSKGQPADTLDILIFGHSYGVDCTEHLPKLIDAAGIRTVRLARFYKGNCSLKERYKFFQEDWEKGYNECEPGQIEWKERPCTFKEAISARKWDYVIFQNSLENEGRYKTSQPYLNDMVSYIRSTSMEKFGSEPEFCWNMFWPISDILSHTQTPTQSFRMSFYDHNPEKMFNAYMAATKELMEDTGITNIIPSGTAVMNLRASYLNTTDANDFTRDGYHMSFGAGRYAAACVFFEYFIAPYYGISVLGNSLRLPGYDHQVTDENAAFIQKCAVEAVQNPFTVNTELGPVPAPKRKLIGGLKVVELSQAGNLKYSRDFIDSFSEMQSLNLTLKEQLRKTDIVTCKRVLRQIFKDKYDSKVIDVLSNDEFVLEKTYNSLRHIVAIDQYLDKPVKTVNATLDIKDAYMLCFRDVETKTSSIVVWNDNKQPDKKELMGSLSLTFKKLPYKEPICVDMRTGAVYSPVVDGNVIRDIPYYDSPVIITDKKMIAN